MNLLAGLTGAPQMPGPQPTQAPPPALAALAGAPGQAPPAGGPPGVPPAMAALAGAQEGPRARPAPDARQTAAAVHHFGEIKAALKPIIDDPKLGEDNLRPKVLDQMSKLLGDRILTLPQVMEALKALPADPLAQKKFVEKVYEDNTKAQMMVLEHHAAGEFAPPEAGAPEESPYSADNHGDLMSAMMKHYEKGR